MIIKKIEVKGFGKFEGRSFSLAPGLQVIYGANESGKSTLMEFIKIMLYSRRKGESTTAQDKALRAKYSPWSKAAMCGKMEFEHGGCDYILQKEINPTSVLKDATILQNLTTGEVVELGKRQEVGEYLFSLDLDSFERSGFIENLGKSGFENVKTSDDSILNKILNLSQTGEAEVSALKVISRIEEAKKDLERSHGRLGKIPELKNKVEDAKRQISSFKQQRAENLELLEQAEKIKLLIVEKKSLEDKIISADNLSKISGLESLLGKVRSTGKRAEKFGGFEKLSGVVSSLSEFKKEIDLSERKMLELKEKIALTPEDFKPVFESDLEILGKFTKEREILKDKMSRLSASLNFKTAEDFSGGVLEESPELKPLVSRLGRLASGLKQRSSESKIKAEETENLIKKKLSSYKKEGLVHLGLLMLLLAAGIFVPGAFFLSGIYAVFGVLRVLWVKKQLSSLKKSLKDDPKKSENLAAFEAFEKTRFEIADVIGKSVSVLNSQITACSAKIKNFLQEKNAESVKEIYELYAKTRNLEEQKAAFAAEEKTLQSLKSEFLSITAVYEDFESFEKAAEFFTRLIGEKEAILAAKNEIASHAKILGLESCDEEYLEGQLEKLRSFCPSFRPEDLKEFKSRLEELKSLELEDSYIRIMRGIKNPEKSSDDLNQELKAGEEELKGAQSYFESLKIAESLVEQASFEIRKNFNPKLNAEASRIFSGLTGGKYEKIYICSDYKILVEHEMMQRECESLSSGTIDQAYLSLRIAISKLISKCKIPLILDDSLVRYDCNRAKNALKFLSSETQIPQIIIFTCSEFIASLAEESGINVLNI